MGRPVVKCRRLVVRSAPSLLQRSHSASAALREHRRNHDHWIGRISSVRWSPGNGRNLEMAIKTNSRQTTASTIKKPGLGNLPEAEKGADFRHPQSYRNDF